MRLSAFEMGRDTDGIKSDVFRVSPESGHWWAVYEYTPLGAERSTRRSREAVLVDVLSDPLFARFPSHHKEGNANKLLSAMRHAFGGHVEPR
jgi:hypothetical protein